MWKCDKCGREFKRKNQSHSCSGDKPNTIDEYINSFDGIKKDTMDIVRKEIKDVLPDATETIKWGMPTYFQGENIIHFAAHKNHLGIHPGEEAISEFKEKIEALGHVALKGIWRIPWGEEIPIKLIQEIALYNLNNRKNTNIGKK